MGDFENDNNNINFEEFSQLGLCSNTRVIYIPQTIETGAYYNFDLAISALELDSDEPITVNINSYGGIVDEALAITARIMDSSCPIFTVCYGTAQSAATIILASGVRRYASKYATAMMHHGSYELAGAHNNIKHEVKWKDLQEKRWSEHMEGLTKKSKSFWSKAIANNSLYMDANDMLKYGLVDEII